MNYTRGSSLLCTTLNMLFDFQPLQRFILLIQSMWWVVWTTTCLPTSSLCCCEVWLQPGNITRKSWPSLKLWVLVRGFFVSETDELIQALTCRASVLQPLQFVHCAIASMSLPQTSSYSNSYVFQHNFILIAKYKLCEFASILWLIFRFLTTFTYQFLKCCW